MWELYTKQIPSHAAHKGQQLGGRGWWFDFFFGFCDGFYGDLGHRLRPSPPRVPIPSWVLDRGVLWFVWVNQITKLTCLDWGSCRWVDVTIGQAASVADWQSRAGNVLAA